MRLRLRRRPGGSRARWTRPDNEVRRERAGGGGRIQNCKTKTELEKIKICSSLSSASLHCTSKPKKTNSPFPRSLSFPSFTLRQRIPRCKDSREASLADRGKQGQRQPGFSGRRGGDKPEYPSCLLRLSETCFWVSPLPTHNLPLPRRIYLSNHLAGRLSQCALRLEEKKKGLKRSSRPFREQM